jgi:hypothetical protein
LQELLEPRYVEELLDRELVASPPSVHDIPSLPMEEGKVVEGHPMAVMDSLPTPDI